MLSNNQKGMVYIRSWQGFRILFSGSKLHMSKDKYHVPIFKMKKYSDRERAFAIQNVKRIMGNIEPEYAWLFAFCNAVYSLGDLPFMMSEWSDSQIKRMQNVYYSYLDKDFELDYNELLKFNPIELQLKTGDRGLPIILERILDGETSVVAAMRYHRFVEKIDLTPIEKSRGLLSKRLFTVLDICFYLEDKYHISDEILNIQSQLIKD